MSWLLLGCILVVAWLCLRCALVVSWLCLRCVLGVFWVFLDCVLNVYWLRIGCVLVVSSLCAGCVLVVAWSRLCCVFQRKEQNPNCGRAGLVFVTGDSCYSLELIGHCGLAAHNLPAWSGYARPHPRDQLAPYESHSTCSMIHRTCSMGPRTGSMVHRTCSCTMVHREHVQWTMEYA